MCSESKMRLTIQPVISHKHKNQALFGCISVLSKAHLYSGVAVVQLVVGLSSKWKVGCPIPWVFTLILYFGKTLNLHIAPYIFIECVTAEKKCCKLYLEGIYMKRGTS